MSSKEKRTAKIAESAGVGPEGGNVDRRTASSFIGNIAVNDPETIAFDDLRTEAHRQMREDFKRRLKTNRTPTPEEISLGTYVENLEPQVRDATMEMRRKGYDTGASGFSGSDYDWRVLETDNPDSIRDPRHRRGQIMDFSRRGYRLSEETRQRLSELGAEVCEYPDDQYRGWVFRIGFEPKTPDMTAIKKQWNDIVAVLPESGEPVPAVSALPFQFRPYANT